MFFELVIADSAVFLESLLIVLVGGEGEHRLASNIPKIQQDLFGASPFRIRKCQGAGLSRCAGAPLERAKH